MFVFDVVKQGYLYFLVFGDFMFIRFNNYSMCEEEIGIRLVYEEV